MLKYSLKKLYPFIILILVFCCISVQAQELEGEPISLLVGQIRIVPVDSPTRVSIADPKIADILSISEIEMILGGKSQGHTTLTIWDKTGEKASLIRVFSEDLDQLKQEIDQLFAKLEITGITSQVNEAQSRIILTGKIQEEQKALFEDAVKSYQNYITNLTVLDEKNPLVMIDVEILEIGKDDLDKLGINWSDSLTFTQSPATQTGTLSELIRITDWTREALSFKLDFLKTEGRARTLSRPKLVCKSGKKAEFVVGGEVPVPSTTTTQTTTAAGVTFKKYGISLNIEPKVKNNEDINIILTTEISDVDWAHTVTTSLGTIPTFTTRNASTELYLKDGQTVFLAGLLKNKDSKNLDKVPGLAEVPILGALFTSKRYQLDQTELVISLTPKIVREGAGIREPEESLVAQMEPGRIQGQAIVKRQIPQDPLSQYAYAIQGKISEAARYPDIAEEARWEGEVRLSLHVLSDGNLDDVLLIKPSSINLLDEAALALVRSQAPFPAFPPQIQNKDLWMGVTIQYQKD